MSKSSRGCVAGTNRPASHAGRRKAASKPGGKVTRAGSAPNQAASAESVQSLFGSSPLVVDAKILTAAAEIADALAARDSRIAGRGSEFWHAITKFAGISTTFLDAGHLNAMLSFTKNANANVRRYAALAIVQVGGGKSYCLPEALASTVLAGMNSIDPEVRFAIVPVLAKLADMSPQIRAKAFACAIRVLKDGEDERIRARCLNVLTAFGVDLVSSVAGEIEAAIDDESPSVRRSACNLLGWLGDDAIGAIDKLIRRVAADEDEEVRRGAAVAIAKINPSGDHLRFGPEDQSLRDDLLRFLREAGAGGRALRRSLEHGQSKESSASASDLDLDSQLFDALSKTQLKFVQYLLKKGKPVSFSELRKSVWRGETTDGNIEKTVRRTNERLLLKQIRLTLYTKSQHVSVTRHDK
jgi:hypothetical protein